MKYKIKVGIDEFDVLEDDVPRIVEAMQTDNLVRLKCGVFRGKTILGVYEDVNNFLISSSSPPSIEKIQEQQLYKNIENCTVCSKPNKGWVLVSEKLPSGSFNNSVRPCICRKPVKIEMPS